MEICTNIEESKVKSEESKVKSVLVSQKRGRGINHGGEKMKYSGISTLFEKGGD